MTVGITIIKRKEKKKKKKKKPKESGCRVNAPINKLNYNVCIYIHIY